MIGKLLVAGGIALALVAVAQADKPDSDALECLALNAYFEARSEGYVGMKAVSHVVMNRVADPAFPSTVCAVVKQGYSKAPRCEFSWWCDGKSDTPLDEHAWTTANWTAWQVQEGWFATDITYGALWYHADYVDPWWNKSMTKTVKIGRHIFYRR